MRSKLNAARCIVALCLVLVAGSVTASPISAQDPTATGVTDAVAEAVPEEEVTEEADDFDDWGLLGLLGLAGLAGLLRKPKTEVQPVTRTVVEPPLDNTRR